MTASIAATQEEVWSLLKLHQCVYLATSEGDQPRVRPVTLLNLDRKFWIATGTRSAKARQMRRNPNVEFCLPLTAECGQGYVRVSGLASAVSDPDTREKIGQQIPFLGEYWTGSDDPQFALFRITRVEIEYLKPGEMTPVTFIVAH
ncbi:MAG: pyridoxamine 5'-phosphate oxidase family protein [Candidatus Bipolaricaulota bacterium]